MSDPTLVDYSTRMSTHGVYCGCRECIDWHQRQIVELQVKYAGRLRELNQVKSDCDNQHQRIAELRAELQATKNNYPQAVNIAESFNKTVCEERDQLKREIRKLRAERGPLKIHRCSSNGKYKPWPWLLCSCCSGDAMQHTADEPACDVLNRLQAELTELRESMTWSTEPPTEPGTYHIEYGGKKYKKELAIRNRELCVLDWMGTTPVRLLTRARWCKIFDPIEPGG